MAIEWKALLNYLLIIYVFVCVFFFKCEAVSVSNKWYIVHTLQNITDSILCLVYWAGVGKNTVE